MARKPYSVYKTTLKYGVTKWNIRRDWNDARGRYLKTTTAPASVTSKKQAEAWAEKNLQTELTARDDARNPVVAELIRQAYNGPDTPYARSQAQRVKRDGGGLDSHYERRKRREALEDFTGPPWDRMRILDLRPYHVEDWAAGKIAGGWSGKNAKNRAQRLLSVYNWHTKRYGLQNELRHNIEFPTTKARRRGALTLLEMRRIIELEPLQGDDAGLLRAVQTLFLTGLRLNELRGLAWIDYDAAAGLLHIRRQLASYSQTETKPPKAGSAGDVPVLDPLPSILAEQHEQTGPDGWIFRALGTDHPYTEDAVRATFYTALDRAGINEEQQRQRFLSPHSARHSFITLLQLSGFSPLEAQRAARHSKIEMTGHYSHGEIIDFSSRRAALADALKAAGEG